MAACIRLMNPPLLRSIADSYMAMPSMRFGAPIMA